MGIDEEIQIMYEATFKLHFAKSSGILLNVKPVQRQITERKFVQVLYIPANMQSFQINPFSLI